MTPHIYRFTFKSSAFGVILEDIVDLGPTFDSADGYYLPSSIMSRDSSYTVDPDPDSSFTQAIQPAFTPLATAESPTIVYAMRTGDM